MGRHCSSYQRLLELTKEETLGTHFVDPGNMRKTIDMQGEAIGMALLMHLEIWQEATYAVEHMATTTTTGADTEGSGAYVKIEG